LSLRAAVAAAARTFLQRDRLAQSRIQLPIGKVFRRIDAQRTI